MTKDESCADKAQCEKEREQEQRHLIEDAATQARDMAVAHHHLLMHLVAWLHRRKVIDANRLMATLSEAVPRIERGHEQRAVEILIEELGHAVQFSSADAGDEFH